MESSRNPVPSFKIISVGKPQSSPSQYKFKQSREHMAEAKLEEFVIFKIPKLISSNIKFHRNYIAPYKIISVGKSQLSPSQYKFKQSREHTAAEKLEEFVIFKIPKLISSNIKLYRNYIAPYEIVIVGKPQLSPSQCKFKQSREQNAEAKPEFYLGTF